MGGTNTLTITLVTGHPGVFSEPTEHELDDNSPSTIAHALSTILKTPTSIALSLPCALTDEERKQYRETLRELLPEMEIWYAMDHSTAYLNHIENEFTHRDQELSVLFLDLTTPNQATGKLISIDTDDGNAYFFPESKIVAETIEAATETLTTKPLHALYILGSEASDLGLGAASNVSEMRFVTRHECSRGAAASRERHGGVITTQLLGALFTPVPISVSLADGSKVVCVPRNCTMPLKRTAMFTTAREEQKSATLEFWFGDAVIGKVVIPELVASKPRISVTVSIEEEGATRVCVEEIGVENGNRVEVWFGEPAISKEEIEAYVNAHQDEGLGFKGSEGDVVGELPE